jgi:hypothetical protein
MLLSVFLAVTVRFQADAVDAGIDFPLAEDSLDLIRHGSGACRVDGLVSAPLHEIAPLPEPVRHDDHDAPRRRALAAAQRPTGPAPAM